MIRNGLQVGGQAVEIERKLCHSVCQLAFPKKICIRKNSFSKVEKCHSLIIFTWTQLRSLWRHIKMRSTSLFSTISSVWLGTRVAINQSWSLTELNVVDFKTLSCSWRYFKKCYAGFTTLGLMVEELALPLVLSSSGIVLKTIKTRFP